VSSTALADYKDLAGSLKTLLEWSLAFVDSP